MDPQAEPNFTVTTVDAPVETQTAQVAQSEPGVTYFEKDPTTGQIKMVGGTETQQQTTPEVTPEATPEVAPQEPYQPQAVQAQQPQWIPVTDPYGNTITHIPNDPQVISSQIYRKDDYIRQLHESLDAAGIARPGHSAPRQPKPSSTQPLFDTSAIEAAAREAALESFPKEMGDGTPVDISPISKTIAKAIEKAVGPAMQQLSEIKQQTEAARVVAEYRTEIAEIQGYDPRFTLDDPEVRRMAQTHPDWTPKQIHKELIYLESLNKQRAPQPQQAPQTAPVQTHQQSVPPQMFSTPSSGSAPMSATAQDSSPDVVAAVKAYEDNCRYNGKSPTEDGRRMVRAQTVAMRSANSDKSFILQTR